MTGIGKEIHPGDPGRRLGGDRPVPGDTVEVKMAGWTPVVGTYLGESPGAQLLVRLLVGDHAYEAGYVFRAGSPSTSLRRVLSGSGGGP